MRGSTLRLTLAIGVVACPWGLALGDGCYWPEQAIPKMPEIPAQRAIISFREGTETLIVESAVKSASAKVGWILPLPAEPTKIEAVDPGILTTAWFCTRPRMITYTYTYEKVQLGVGILLLALSTVVAFFSRRGKRAKRVLIVLVAGFWLWVVLTSASTGHLGVGLGGGPIVPGVSLLQTTRAGSYDVAVLRADAPQALSDWLGANGLRRPDQQGQAILQDYISRKWCFAVATLRVEEGKASTPHPLSVTFPAAQPVYPMRLTALAGTTLDLELYVIADQRAGQPSLEVEFADRYDLWTVSDPPHKTSRGQVSEGVGLPELCELMWDRCMLTKLTGSLSPEQMDSDLTIELNGRRTKRNTFWTQPAARGRAELVALVCLVAAVVMALAWAISAARPKALLIGVAAVFVLGFGVGGATWLSLPKIEGVRTSGGKGGPAVVHPRLVRHLGWEFSREGKISPEMSDEALGKRFLEWLPEWAQVKSLDNPFQPGAIRLEKSPGNFWVETFAGRRYLVAYDLSGSPDYVDLFALTELEKPTTQPEQPTTRPKQTHPAE